MLMPSECPCELSGTSECSPLHCAHDQATGYSEIDIGRALKLAGIEAKHSVERFWIELRRIK